MHTCTFKRNDKFSISKHCNVRVMCNYNHLTVLFNFTQIPDNCFKNKFTIKIIFWLIY